MDLESPWKLLIDLSAQGRSFIYDRGLDPSPTRFDRGGEAGRSASDDNELPLVVGIHGAPLLPRL